MPTVRASSNHYGLTVSNRTRLGLEPRGVRALLDKVRGDPDFAVTGSLAASIIALVAPAALGSSTSVSLELPSESSSDVPTGANVLLVEPFSPVAFERTWEREGIRYATPAKVAADLRTSPGRSPSEGEAVIEWIKANENDWRI